MIMAVYDDIADEFSARADELAGNKLYERPATIKLLPPLKGLDVLDAGCGSGFYTQLAHRAGARVVAYDPSKEMIRHAVKRVPDAEIIHCTTAELEKRLSGRKFDLILSTLVLHYVDHLDTEFSLLAARLKRDGQMIVSMKHPFAHFGFIAQHGYRSRGLVQMNMQLGTLDQIQRPLGAITGSMSKAGLVIEKLIEPFPSPELKERDPSLFEMGMKGVPPFIQFVLRLSPPTW